MTTEIFKAHCKIEATDYAIVKRTRSGGIGVKVRDSFGAVAGTPIISYVSLPSGSAEKLRDALIEAFPLPVAEGISTPAPTRPFEVGDKVRMIADDPKHGLGDVKVGDVGVIKDIAEDGEFIVDFPEQDKWYGYAKEFELVEAAPWTPKVGDRVRMIATTTPRFGWGSVKTGDIGVITRANSGDRIRADFPAQSGWYGRQSEFELVVEQPALKPVEVKAAPPVKVKSAPRVFNLSDQARKVYRHMEKAGSISARDAMDDYSMTSATLSRRICDIEAEGFKVTRLKRFHPMTGGQYTRYELG